MNQFSEQEAAMVRCGVATCKDHIIRLARTNSREVLVGDIMKGMGYPQKVATAVVSQSLSQAKPPQAPQIPKASSGPTASRSGGAPRSYSPPSSGQRYSSAGTYVTPLNYAPQDQPLRPQGSYPSGYSGYKGNKFSASHHNGPFTGPPKSYGGSTFY